MQNKTKHYEFIDALRGIAILGVLAVHSKRLFDGIPSLLFTYLEQGARGVQLFFIISALTLFMSLTSRSKIEKNPTLNFFIRRFFRIAPLFYVGIIFYTLKNGVDPSYWAPYGLGIWHILSTVFFFHGWFPTSINSVVPGGWSIAVEMMFYLIVPFLFQKINNLKKIILLLLITIPTVRIITYIVYYLLLPLFSDNAYIVSDFSGIWFFAQLPIFLLGILLFYLFQICFKKKEVLKNMALPMLVFSIIAILLYPFLQSFYCFRLILPTCIYFGIIFVFFALALSIYPVKLFVNKITMFLGKISFSFYIWHFFILGFLGQYIRIITKEHFIKIPLFFEYFLVMIILISIIAFFSYLSYRFIEIPGIKWGKKIIIFLENK